VKASFREHDDEQTFSAKIEAWCEDSLLLLDLMSDLSPRNGHLIKKEGRRFFANINYKFAGHIPSFMDRMIAYLVVWKRFQFSYAPPPLRKSYSYIKTIFKRLFNPVEHRE
jgi:hypothetical protein